MQILITLWRSKIFDFNYRWIHRGWKYAEILLLLSLMMTTIFVMPQNVRGEQFYQYRDKEGTIVITDRPPPQQDIPSDTGKIKSYQDSTSEERLHRGRDNALVDQQNKKQRKTAETLDAGRHEIKIKKVGSNLYQDISKRIIIKTIACVEPAGGDESILDWTGSRGELYFKKTSKSCIVKNVYK